MADCGDGLLVTTSRERRLEILQDSRLGTFGVIVLVLFLLLKVMAVAALPSPAFALVVAPVLGRWFILIAARQPSARPGGMGDAFAASLPPAALVVAAIVPILLIIGGIWFDGRSALAVLLALLADYLILRVARTRLGGVTGDVYGLVVEMTELMVLLAFTVYRLGRRLGIGGFYFTSL